MAEVWHIAGVERLLSALYGEPMRFALLAERMGYTAEQCASLVDRRELYLMRTAVALIRENLHRSLWAYGVRAFDVLVKRYGLEDGQAWTCRRLAAEHGISVERISQVQEQAVKRLSTRISRSVLDVGLRAAITTLLGESPPCYRVKPEDPELEQFHAHAEVGAVQAVPKKSEPKGLAYRPRFMAAVRTVLEAHPPGLSSEMIVSILKGLPGASQANMSRESWGSFLTYSPSRLMAALIKLEASGHLVRKGHLVQAGEPLLTEAAARVSPGQYPQSEERNGTPPVPAEKRDLNELPGLIRETLGTVPDGLSLSLLVHVLRGSDGPVTVEKRDRYGISTWGALRDYSYVEVKAAVERLVGDGALRMSGGKIHVRTG